MSLFINQSFANDMNALGSRGMRKGLEGMSAALEACSHPELAYPIVHVAGTNGKGSSCTFLAQFLAQNGYRVGLALSPHVETFFERIQIFDIKNRGSNTLASESEVEAVHLYFKNMSPSFFGLTYFEYALLLALEHFKQEKVDVVVLETGLGGRWDATNACPSVVSGVVSVGLDHMNELGDTVEKIFTEKIQIIKPHAHFICGVNDPDLVKMALAHCLKVGASFKPLTEHTPFLDKLQIKNISGVFKHNLSFALTLAESLETKGFRFDWNKTYSFSLPPARVEKLKSNPDWILDGAHNEPALLELKKFMNQNYGDVYDLVFGCLDDRKALDLVPLILPKSGHLYWVDFMAPKKSWTLPSQESVKSKFGGESLVLNSDFFKKISNKNNLNPVLITGSFYLCGEFKRILSGEIS